jgi:hypothetical protein
MLQLVVWMLCVYMVLKGKELQLIAGSSSDEYRPGMLRSARAWSIVAYVAAGVFFLFSLVQGNSMPSTPTL